MLRLIARLDIKNADVIKGIHLEGQRRIGNPLDLAAKYYREGIDEILFMDSVASLYDRNNLFDTVAEACRSVFVPITMGGGIRSLRDVEQALASGADKVAVNTALVRDPELVSEIARVYGSQCLVASIEAKRKPGGTWEAYISNGREPTGRDVLDWARELEDRGAGEVLITSVDQEGTQRGFETELYRQAEQQLQVPLIACGGAGNIAHFTQLEAQVRVQAIATASVLHYGKATIDGLKAALPRTSARRKPEDAGNH